MFPQICSPHQSQVNIIDDGDANQYFRFYLLSLSEPFVFTFVGVVSRQIHSKFSEVLRKALETVPVFLEKVPGLSEVL